MVDDEILTTVTTVEGKNILIQFLLLHVFPYSWFVLGSVLIYRYSLFGARSAQVKCSSLVEVGAQEDRKVTKEQDCSEVLIQM